MANDNKGGSFAHFRTRIFSRWSHCCSYEYGNHLKALTVVVSLFTGSVVLRNYRSLAWVNMLYDCISRPLNCTCSFHFVNSTHLWYEGPIVDRTRLLNWRSYHPMFSIFDIEYGPLFYSCLNQFLQDIDQRLWVFHLLLYEVKLLVIHVKIGLHQINRLEPWAIESLLRSHSLIISYPCDELILLLLPVNSFFFWNFTFRSLTQNMLKWELTGLPAMEFLKQGI